MENLPFSGEKPYKCDLCAKFFYHSSTMNRHKRSHFKTNSKLYLFGGLPAPSKVEEENEMDPPPLYMDTKPEFSLTHQFSDAIIDDSLLLNHIQIEIDTKPVQLIQTNIQGE